MFGLRLGVLALHYGGTVTMRRMTLLAVALCLLSAPAAAHAVPGDIAGQSCISKLGTEGCAPLAEPEMLSAANGVAVAPDGTDVYVGAGRGIAHFRRAADGALTYASCVDTNTSPFDACPTASAPPDGGGSLSLNAISIAISPDGAHVYAVSWADALVWWNRDPLSGELTWGGCRDGASDSATNGRCGTATTFAGGNFPADSMDFTQGIAVTPDGQTIYIADQEEGLLQAQRSTATGVATPTACFNAAGSAAAGCTTTPSGTPIALSGIDVGSNSRDVYVRSISPGGITHFTRSAGGTTSFASCVGSGSPSGPCTTAAPSPVFSYSGSLGVAGGSVFTYGGNYGTPSGTLARFGRNADGSLVLGGCVTTEAAPGPCAPFPPQTLSGSIGRLLVSPDASNVYLPQGGISERVLTRATGSLEFGSCLSDTGVAACAPPPLAGPFSVSPGQMALSPDGRQIYQPGAHTLNVFEIEQEAPITLPPLVGDPGPPPATLPAAGPAPVDLLRLASKPKIKSVKRRKGGRYLVKVRVGDAGRIKARFVGRLEPKGKRRNLGRPATRRAAKPGTYVLTLRPPAAALERRIRAKLIVRIVPDGYRWAQARIGLRLK